MVTRESVIVVHASAPTLRYGGNRTGGNNELDAMLLTFVSIVVVGGAGAAYWLFARRAPESGRAPQKPRAAGRFGAVEIRMRSNACAAAKALEGQRFLARSAPALPLPSCDAAHCSCSFGKLSDRRTESRRLEHGGLSATLFLTNNRRGQDDRRADPAEPDGPQQR